MPVGIFCVLVLYQNDKSRFHIGTGFCRLPCHAATNRALPGQNPPDRNVPNLA